MLGAMAEQRGKSRSPSRGRVQFWCRHLEGDQAVWQLAKTEGNGPEEEIAQAGPALNL